VLWLLFTLTALLIAAGVATLIALGMVQLRSSSARARDGLLPGTNVEHLLGDMAKGRTLFLFTDHSIVEFPNLISRVRDLQTSERIVFLPRRNVELARAVCDAAGLNQVAVRLSEQKAYEAWNIVGLPFAVLVDDGVVRAGALVSADGALDQVLLLSDLPADTARKYITGTTK
jgi:hypothetical protein